MELFKKTANIDFMSKRSICLAISFILILSGIISLIIKGGPKYGIDFTGGIALNISFKEKPSYDKIRNSLENIGIKDIIIQEYGRENEVIIRFSGKGIDPNGLENRIKDKLKKNFPKNPFDIKGVQMIGPKVSRDLRRKGILAVIYATIGILIYVGFRFKPLWGAAGVIALIHDVSITLGIFSLTNKEIDLTVVAAFLTIVGYSINDTIVVFDRIRENLNLRRKGRFEDIINMSINQTLSRTILTSFTVLVVVIILFFFGGEVIHNFAFALIIGVITGTYSSIFIASPIIVSFRGAGNLIKKRRA
jgi:preprotein translocase subunit SecF